VLREPLDDVAFGPAASVLQRLGEIPVVERRERHDAALAQPLRQTTVEVDPLLVDGAATVGLDARPRDGEAVRLQAKVAHEIEVLSPAVVVLARRVTRVAAGHVARRCREAVPDRLAPAVGPRRALDLEGGCPGAPQE